MAKIKNSNLSVRFPGNSGKKYRIAVLALLLCAAIVANAANFKIIYMTTPGITIGGKKMKVGSIFSDKDKIEWTAERQAMKVMDTDTKKQSLIVAENYRQKGARNLSSYLKATKQLSTRKGAFLNTLEMGSGLEEEYYLLDTLEFKTRLKTDERSFFYCSYEYGDETINKRLNSEEGRLIIDRSIYMIDGEPIKPFDVELSIWYLDGEKGTSTLVKDTMLIKPTETEY